MKKAAYYVFSLFVISYLLLVTPQAFAQTKNEQTNPNTTPNTNPDVPRNLHTWTQNVMIEVMSAMSCQISGIDPTDPKGKCLGFDQKTGKIGYVESEGGAIGVTGHMISMLYTPPLHTSDYFQNLAQNFGITKSANAQRTGTGFEGLRPLLGVWTSFRNVVYLFFVIVFVAIGLAIMLRVRIDPRTVMTIQNQIPKIIIGILLVTFSYAIAGFLVDIMYASIYIIANLIVSADSSLDPSLATQLAQTTNTFQAAELVSGKNALGMWNFASSPATAIKEIVGSFMPYKDSIIARIFNFFSPIDDFLKWTAFFLAYFIISIALLVALFRLFFALLFSYIYILIGVVLSPFWILGSLVPGSPISVSGWLRDIIANLSAFPVTIAMFLLGKVFIDVFGLPDADKVTQFVPPLIGNRASTDAIGAIIGLGIILLTPNVVNMMKAILKAPKLDTSAAGRGIGAGVGVLTAPAKPVIQGFSFLAGQKAAKGLPFIGNWLESQRTNR